MDRGLIHKSSRLVGEIMGEGHGWWSVNNLRPPFEEQQHNPSLFLPASATTTSSSSPLHSFSSLLLSNHYPLPTTSAAAAPWQNDSSIGDLGQLQEPWNNLFIGRTSSGGLANAEEGIRHKSWEGHALIPSRTGAEADGNGIGSSSSSSSSSYIYSTAASHGQSGAGDEIRLAWGGAAGHHNHHHHHHQQASSPRSSCITSTTSLGSNLLEFSNNAASPRECISSTASGAAFKKARTQEEPSQTTQSTVKVRKEKLGDRINALHQLVSPFGKTDTASVLLEAIGYIRFLHSQIEVLSSPYQPGGGNGGGGSSSNQQHEASVQQGERNSIFPEDPGQLLHDKTLRKRGHPDQDVGDEEAKTKDLRSRGLCLVPVSCTLDVGADTGPADYWAAAPPFGMGFGR